jgi:hypothetical protein
LWGRENKIDRLPQNTIAEVLTSLSELYCSGCPSLWSPPPEICQQGGKAPVDFIRAVKLNGKFNLNMNLFLIGDGEAGKTSLIMALRSKSDHAHYIRNDHRTVGIDISRWSPSGEDLHFSIFDLAGQAVYSKSHRFFLLLRAIYINDELVGHAFSKTSYQVKN